MEMNQIDRVEELEKFINESDAAAIYFSTEYCNVCKVLKPKVIEFLNENYPNVNFAYVDIEKNKEIAGKYSIFSVPTIIFYFGGTEAFRKSRNFSLAELYQAVERPYNMLFS